jgi:hypothetical protein
MSFWGTGGDYYPVYLFTSDGFLDLSLGITSTGKHLIGHINDVGQRSGKRNHLIHVDDAGNVAATMADKNADPGISEICNWINVGGFWPGATG